jgi:hypothetical protein
MTAGFGGAKKASTSGGTGTGGMGQETKGRLR